MSASSFVAVMLGDDEILAKSHESDLTKVEGSVANYYNYKKKDGTVLKDIAWFYPTPKKGAEQVADRVAFYVGKNGLKLGSPPVDA
ncbi:hypothetical protein QFC21_003453 [Naganishia friedmannii]|uniref:Uncharacterized protein n=1 Tax=Naganishia friedmannii TaxID=89922 RepID=A0ACC2VQE0_9TREE|nr:hypothetical protein QFC21_003453 [Naganishia friedmannii]